MKRFGVIGHPIVQSLSPLLHNSAYSLLGLECKYEAFDIEPGSLSAALRDFKIQGFAGLNVTIPHKETVWSLVDELSDEAKAVGAVNTLSLTRDGLRGDNTDVYGVARSLEPFRDNFQEQVVLIIGAGGSARAITYTLLTTYSPAEIFIANRDQARARDLVTHFAPYAKGSILKAITASDESIRQFIERAKLIINATSVGMYPAFNHMPVSEQTMFHPKQVVLDIIYTPLETRFLKLAARCGARTIRGLEVFLHQGARSFELWLGHQMPVDQLRPLMERELNRQQVNQSS